MAEDTVLNYSPLPTLREFHESPARFRCIVGPVGSGKTTAAAWELCYYIPLQMAKHHDVKKTRWLILRNCYDDKTEILTETRGFQLFRDLLSGDKVATLQDEKIVYELPNAVAVHPYKGEMIGFEGEGVNFLVTPDHQMWVSKRRTRKRIWCDFEMKLAQDIYGSELYRVRRDAEWHGDDVGLSDKDFELIGFWLAEGSFGKYKNAERYIITQTKPDGIEYTRELLKVTSVDFAEWHRSDGGINFSLRCNDSVLFSFLRDTAGACSKTIPAALKVATKSNLRALVDGFMVGDGHTRKDSITKTAYTSSKNLADDLQEIALKAGMVANVSERDRIGDSVCVNGSNGKVNSKEYTITFLCEKKHRPILKSQSHAGQNRGWYKEDYDGIVYCVEMPIPTVFVRRNGKAFWCNRTYPELIDTTQKTVFDWFSWGDYKIQRKEYLLAYPSRGIEVEILFRSCDNPKDVRHFKSLELTGYWIDESIEVGEDVKLMLANRIGRYPRKSPRSYGIQTTNPPDIEDPTYFQFKWATPIPGPIPETKPLAEHTGFWQPPNENNANLPEGYYKKLIEAYANNLDWADRYVRGMPGITIRGKSVYNNFRRDLHVAKEPLQYTGGPLFAGWDNTGNCPACVIGYMPTAGLLHILREYHTERMGIVDFTHYVVADRNNRWPNAEWTEWGDPAGEAKFSKSGGGLTSNADLMREEANISLLKSEQNWEARRESVEFQLGRLVAGEPAILIDPSCHRLINGFIGGYCYPEVGTTGMFRETPEKNKFSHIHDALQYMCVMLFRNVRYRGRGKSSTTFEFSNLRHRSSTSNVGYKEIYA